jgi:hypothetical protein
MGRQKLLSIFLQPVYQHWGCFFTILKGSFLNYFSLNPGICKFWLFYLPIKILMGLKIFDSPMARHLKTFGNNGGYLKKLI